MGDLVVCEIKDLYPVTSIIWHSKLSNTINMDLSATECCELRYYLGAGGIDCEELAKHFRDWKQPTQQEKDMYEMLTGVKIMWSEEHPFKTLEDE